MRIARWQRIDGVVESGFVHDGHAVPLPGGRPVDVLVQAGLPVALAAGQDLVGAADRSDWRPLDAVRLLAPLLPGSIRHFSTFEQHEQGVAHRGGVVPDAWYRAPAFSFRNPHVLLGPTDPLVPPFTTGLDGGLDQALTGALDLGLEVAAVIGATRECDGRNMSIERSHQQVLGYAIFVDWCVRDVPRAVSGDAPRDVSGDVGPSTAHDVGSTLGPWIVTADELADRHDAEGLLDLGVEVEVNGALVGRDSLTRMGWTFAEMVCHASQGSRVAPGDVLTSGTTGNGCLAESWWRTGELLPPPLVTGDRVTIRVDGIGETTTSIGAPRHGRRTVGRARTRSTATGTTTR